MPVNVVAKSSLSVSTHFVPICSTSTLNDVKTYEKFT